MALATGTLTRIAPRCLGIEALLSHHDLTRRDDPCE